LKAKKCFALLLSTVVFGGCAATAPISGETHADLTLKSDVARKISLWAKVDTGCQRIDAIQTEVIRVNPIGTGDSPAARQYGSVDERWVVSLCDRKVPYLVSFTPDGKGGTFYKTSLEKPQKKNN
jgi:hypothetical protein